MYLLYLLTPWNRVLLEKLTGLQLVKKFPEFYITRIDNLLSDLLTYLFAYLVSYLLTYLLTHPLTQYSTVLLEKLTGLQLVK